MPQIFRIGEYWLYFLMRTIEARSGEVKEKWMSYFRDTLLLLEDGVMVNIYYLEIRHDFGEKQWENL